MLRVLALAGLAGGIMTLAAWAAFGHRATPVAALTNCDNADAAANQDELEKKMVSLINEARWNAGLPSLSTTNSALNRSATWKTKDQFSRQPRSRIDSLGRDEFQRITDCGYAHTPTGEVIGGGGHFGNPDDLRPYFQNLMNDARNASVILDPRARAVGVAEYQGEWTIDFGDYPDGLEPNIPNPDPTPTTPSSATPTTVTTTPTPTSTSTPTPSATPTETPTDTPTPRPVVPEAVVPMVGMDEG
jgi:uncharacterized protein YkwD